MTDRYVRGSFALALLLLLPTVLPAAEPLNGQSMDDELSDEQRPAAEAAIGWKLFFDARLSRDSNVSCATCHDPDLGYGDGKRFSTGTHGDLLTRNTPSVVNLEGAEAFFWDGRAASLEEQATGPMTNPKEMDLSTAEIETRIASDQAYSRAFAAIGVEDIGIDDIASALAAFQRGLVTGETAYDRWLQGDAEALDKRQSNGRFLFFTRGQCAICHIGQNFTDHKFHNVGTGTPADPGRSAVTGREEDRGAFKTPSLRNWRGKEPFMHDGRFETMAEVIDFYAEPPAAEIGESELDPLRFSERDKADLLAFMEALNGEWPDLERYSEVWEALAREK